MDTKDFQNVYLLELKGCTGTYISGWNLNVGGVLTTDVLIDAKRFLNEELAKEAGEVLREYYATKTVVRKAKLYIEL